MAHIYIPECSPSDHKPTLQTHWSPIPERNNVVTKEYWTHPLDNYNIPFQKNQYVSIIAIKNLGLFY